MNNFRNHRGFTLVELMIALLIGMFLLGGLAALVVQTSQSSKSQQSLGRLQENGRFALAKIVADVKMAGAQYCSTHSTLHPVGAMNRHRALSVMADGAMPYGLPTRAQVASVYAPWLVATQPYPMTTRYFIQGHECTTDFNCLPALNAIGSALPVPPAPGIATGLRARAADVLTVRYLATSGVPLASDYTGSGAAVPLDPRFSTAASGPPLNFANNDVAMVTDCARAMVFEATPLGNTLVPNDTTDAGAARNDLGSFTTASNDSMVTRTNGDARVFNMSRDFRTVSYFLQLRSDVDAPPRVISTLVRQANGASEALVDGVERLEFRYGVEGVNGQVRFLDANQVNAATDCQAYPEGLRSQEPGCMWRSVRMIDVALLLNSVTNDAPNELQRYSFTMTGESEVEAPATLASGLPRERLYRREFRTTVMVRNFGL